jgi:hypothetical protein
MTQKVRLVMRHRLRARFCNAKLQPPRETDTDGAPIGILQQPKNQ